ncbi:conserved oligomeric Golgi complex component-related / COG complex component-like protein [Actinidia rufa]|uniref:Conserved oligomeric Golgi complex subunit 7 n=1 Tax=Actinidia rufa TaxID=165716 RepID=A0A7J0ED57_9ERIC|nr:conserved oligomeric Golgi complex component-related / COG complex component-like protein [Actinidia rufa]
MVDLSAFSDEKFDVKKWINAACEARHPAAAEKHLVDLEMKLQMVSEEIAAALEEQSSSASPAPLETSYAYATTPSLSEVPSPPSFLKLKKSSFEMVWKPRFGDRIFRGVLDIISGDMLKGIKVQTKHLEALMELHNMTGTFVRNIQHLFSESDLQVLLDTLKAVYFPYESFKQKTCQVVLSWIPVKQISLGIEVNGGIIDWPNRSAAGATDFKFKNIYGQIERLILSAEIAGVDLRGAVTRGVEAQDVELSETVQRMEESIPQVIIVLEASVERCISFTGGSEADELILALDDETGLDKMETSHSSRKDDFISNEEEWSLVQGALQILIHLVLTLDQNHSHVTSDDGSGEVSLAGRAALDVAAVRLLDVPEKARKIFNLLEQSKDPRFHAFPLASQRVAAFADTVNELVYDVLISKMRQRLSDVSHLLTWSDRPLPSVSAYPPSYVTDVGEYLLTLPQQWEPLAEGISNSDAINDEAQLFATEWMFKVAEGATALYMEQLRGIQHITDRGAQQLSVDIAYLSNVLSALSMPIPTILAAHSTPAFQVSTPREMRCVNLEQ